MRVEFLLCFPFFYIYGISTVIRRSTARGLPSVCLCGSGLAESFAHGFSVGGVGGFCLGADVGGVEFFKTTNA